MNTVSKRNPAALFPELGKLGDALARHEAILRNDDSAIAEVLRNAAKPHRGPVRGPHTITLNIKGVDVEVSYSGRTLDDVEACTAEIGGVLVWSPIGPDLLSSVLIDDELYAALGDEL